MFGEFTFPAFEKYRINVLSALILAALTLVEGISVYVVMQRQAESVVSTSRTSAFWQRIFNLGCRLMAVDSCML
jgi:hypothetical protein